MNKYVVWGEESCGWVIVGSYDNPDEAERARSPYCNSYVEVFDQ